jgi:quinol-cytochrome oxidoreductase complex cytochrome b subunit
MDIELLSPKEALESFNIIFAFALLLFYFVVEALDSSLTFSLTQHKSIRSAIVTFILYVTVAIEIIAIISNYLYIIPVALGAALGSFAIVEYEKKKRPLKKNRG